MQILSNFILSFEICGILVYTKNRGENMAGKKTKLAIKDTQEKLDEVINKQIDKFIDKVVDSTLKEIDEQEKKEKRRKSKK